MSSLTRHHVRIAGAGSPIVFAHGYGCDQNVWRGVAPAFEASHRTVLFDVAGCGASEPSHYERDRHATLHGHADDLIEICEAAGLEGVTFVGHSVSGTIGVLAAAKRPELFDSLVLVSPSPCYLNDGDYRGGFERADIDGLLETLEANHFAWARMMAPLIMGNAGRPALAAELGDNFCRTDARVARHFARVTFLADHRPDLPGVSVPSLVLQCADDALAASSVGHYVADHLPRSTLVHLAATGHCPHMSAPDELVAVLRSWLQRDGVEPGAPAEAVAA